MRSIFSIILICFSFNIISIAQNQVDYTGATTIKRIVEVIDVEVNPNFYLNARTNPFNKIIYELATSTYQGEKITAYRDSSCKEQITADEILLKGRSEETITIYPDPDDPELQLDTTLIDLFRASSIVRYIIKMDSLILPDNLSAYKIIAIAPLYSVTMVGVLLKEPPLFWVKWEDLEELLKTIPFAGPLNVNGKMTYYDFFVNHMFSGSSDLEDIEMTD
ncbi:hypothetical protein ACFLRI_04480 [Bacteroidota bacterium]